MQIVPECSCGKPAHHTGRKDKFGQIIFRKHPNGSYICYGCHMKRIRGIKSYKNKRKNYCENIDGRLGFPCTSTIIDSCVLHVDHILENRTIDIDADKLVQTFCACCHAYKTKFVRNKDTDKIKYMLEKIAEERQWSAYTIEFVLTKILEIQDEKAKENGYYKGYKTMKERLDEMPMKKKGLF